MLLIFCVISVLLAYCVFYSFFFFFSSRRRHTRFDCDWSSDVCSSDLGPAQALQCRESHRDPRQREISRDRQVLLERNPPAIDRNREFPGRSLEECAKIGRASCRERV